MSFRKSLSWLSAAQVISLALQFASSVVFARYLTPHEMGIFAVAVALVGVLSILQQLSLPALIVREENLTEEFTSTAFTINAAVTALLSLAIAGASFVGAAAMRDAGVRDVLLVLAVTPLFGIFSFLPTARLEREGRFKAIALIGACSSIANAAVGVGMVVAGQSYMSIAYAQVVSSGVYAVLAIIAGRRHARFRFGLRSWRRIVAFSAQMLAITGIHGAGQRLTELLMGRLLGLGTLGLYNRSSGLNNLIWSNVTAIVSRVLFVDFSELHRQGVPLRDRYLQTVATMTAALWPAFAGLAVIAKPFIAYVYGEKWVAAAGPLAFLALASILYTSATMTWELFTATGRLRDQTRVETIRVVIGTAAFALGCMVSMEVAAATRVLDAVVALFIYRPYLNEMTQTSSRDFRPIYVQSGIVTLLAIAPAGALIGVSGATLPSVPALLTAILLGMALWAGGLFAMKHPLADEIKRMAARLPQRRRRSPS